MIQKMPWLSSRKNFLILSAFDLCIINFIYIIYPLKFFSNGNSFFLNIFAFLWIITSYTFDKYSYLGEDYKFEFLNSFFRLIKICVFSGLIFSFIVKIFTSLNFEFIETKFLIFLGVISFISYIVEMIYSYFIGKSISKKIKWFSIYKSKTKGSIFSGSVNLFNYGYIESIHISQLYNFHTTNDNYIGFIIEDINSLNKDEKIIILNLRNNGYKLISLIDWLEKYLHRYPPEFVSSNEILNDLLIYKQSNINIRIKRSSEFIVSLIILAFSLPLIIIASICIKLEDGGPIFYSQKRNGFGGKVFTIFKLRSMKINAEKESIRWSSYNDDRITLVGSFLRKSRLDELPQLVSVLKGDMSLIGPRPERPELDEILIKEIPNYKIRYFVRPGLSGWAQVNYPYGASVEDTKVKFSYDIYYIRNFSTLFDLLITLETIRLVFNLRGSQPNKKYAS